jgi:ubiquitin carboxyl-terminal hydrolase 4/11/15
MVELNVALQNPNAYLLFYRRRTNSLLGRKAFQEKEEISRPSQVAPDEHETQDDSIETQLPTPPNESAPASLTSHKVELPTTQDDGTWNLRSIGSIAGSSVSSPPADDPDDESPYPYNLLRQLCDYTDTALKASPTSSNEADADLDTDLDPEDTEWDQPTSIAQYPSPDASFSDIGKFNWDDAKENPFDEAIIVQHCDDTMDTKDQGRAP